MGQIQQLETHSQQSNRNNNHRTEDTLYIDMKHIRLHHYIMGTREKWNQILSRMGVINSNAYFKMIFDDGNQRIQEITLTFDVLF